MTVPSSSMPQNHLPFSFCAASRSLRETTAENALAAPGVAVPVYV